MDCEDTDMFPVHLNVDQSLSCSLYIVKCFALLLIICQMNVFSTDDIIVVLPQGCSVPVNALILIVCQ